MSSPNNHSQDASKSHYPINQLAVGTDEIVNIEKATKASRNGAIAAFISGGVEIFLILYAISTDAQDLLRAWNDPFYFIDVILISVCAFGMLRFSRAAAITMLVYAIFEALFIRLETGQPIVLVAAVVFLSYFGRAIQGSFAYHKIKKTENPEYIAAPKWAYYVGIPVIALFVLFMAFGFLLDTGARTGVFPSTEVVVGSDVSDGHRTLLLDNGLLDESEDIEFFYSYGLTSILDGGSILTDQAVIMFYSDYADGRQIYFSRLAFADIATVEVVKGGDYLNDSIYKVGSHDGDKWLNIALSTEHGRDVQFVEALRRKITE